jgi:hypothetical protein
VGLWAIGVSRVSRAHFVAGLGGRRCCGGLGWWDSACIRGIASEMAMEVKVLSLLGHGMNG